MGNKFKVFSIMFVILLLGFLARPRLNGQVLEPVPRKTSQSPLVSVEFVPGGSPHLCCSA